MTYKLDFARYQGDYEVDPGSAYLPLAPSYRRAVAPPSTQLVTQPLGQLPPPAPLATGYSFAGINIRHVIIAIVVMVVLALVLRQLMKLAEKSKKVERNATVARVSTKELAQRLYDRLEAKGSRTNATTMRSLERLAR